MGKKNGTSPAYQAQCEAQAMWDKRIELGSFENIKDVNNKTYFKPMLAHKLEDYIDDIVYPVLSQPKLDGVRCIDKEDGQFSRTGKPLVSAPHIHEALKPLFEANPDLILDGELYCDKLANDFNKIISLVRKSKPTQADLDESRDIIQYHVLDNVMQN
jgi:DNA ligase-1